MKKYESPQQIDISTLDTTSNRIAAVVVTYNRAQLLSECLESLVHQSRPLDAIYVIDNNSTDNTPAEVEKFVSKYPQIRYLRQATNTGGAGGFNIGVKAAYEDGYDWVWLMDDDVEAYPQALEGLLQFGDRSLCIHGQRTSPNGKVYLWEAQLCPALGFAIPSADKGLQGENKFCTVNVGCFEGMLVHRAVIEKIGFPDARFFIAWDDTIYGYQASKWTKVIYVKHLSLKRKRSQKAINVGFRSFVEVSDLYRFYHIRNRTLVKEYLKNEPGYCALSYNFMTGVLFIKEIIRAALLQKNFFAVKPLWRGIVAGRDLTKKYPVL